MLRSLVPTVRRGSRTLAFATAAAPIFVGLAARADAPLFGGAPVPAITRSQAEMIGLNAESLIPTIMAGVATGGNPFNDSPTARIDPNTNVQPFGGVVAIGYGSASSASALCTGTLIAPDLVLTAAHCVDLVGSDGIADVPPSQLPVFVNSGGTHAATLQVSFIHVNPEYTGFDNPSVGDDLALLRLATPAPSGTPIYPIAALSGVAPTGFVYPLIMVGYGRSGYGDAGFSVGATTVNRRVGANLLEAYYTGETSEGDAATVENFEYDFESTAAGASAGTFEDFSLYPVSSGSSYNSFPYSLGNDVETVVMPGDSGGPAFYWNPNDGQYYLAGVNTYIYRPSEGALGAFGTVGGGVWLEGYVPWLESYVPEPSTWCAAGSIGVLAVRSWMRRRSA